MKLLADENFPPTLVSYLQKKRHNVKRILRNARGVPDSSVISRAKSENRIIITFDKDFLASMPDILGVSACVFEFPNKIPLEIIPYLDNGIKLLIELKRKKKPFIAIFSPKGIKLKLDE